MKRLLLIFLVLLGYTLNAQDKILKKNGEEIISKLIEITPEIIKYKKFDNQEGPTYSIYIKDINKIIFENGKVEIFSKEKEVSQQQPKEYELVDTRNGKKYKTVKIGDQVWMAENLNYESNQSWCYDNSENNCEKLGRLYSFEAACNVCPDGWHLPSDEEWKDLEKELGMQTGVNDKGWRGTSPGQGRLLKISEKSGFEAQLAGSRDWGIYRDLYEKGYFWTSTTQNNGKNAWVRELGGRASIKRDVAESGNAYSVRCLKGESKTNNKAIPEDDKINKVKAYKEDQYISVGIGSGNSYGWIGLRVQGKLELGAKTAVALHYGMGFKEEGYMLGGLKLYYCFFYINAQAGKYLQFDDLLVATMAGIEYPISKNFNVTAGLGYNIKTTSRDNSLAFDIGFSYKLFK